MFKFKIEVGAVVESSGRRYAVVGLLNFENLLAKDLETGRIETLLIKNLAPPAIKEDIKKAPDLITVKDKDWQQAVKRYDSIKDYAFSKTSVGVMKEAAKEKGVHISTIYRWREKFEATCHVSSLVNCDRGGKGKSRLPEEVEKIMAKAIDEIFLTTQKKKVSKVCDEVKKLCKRASIKPPHPNTVRNRINIMNEKMKLEKRGEKKLAGELYDPKPGKFPGADWPLAVIQIDHTPMDVQIVDDVHRTPIGRPWLTVAIDVFSRMILGIYLSLDHPSAASVGMCISMAVLKKDKLLARHGIDLKWPIYGLMTKVHADNGKDFKGGLLTKICLDYTIILEWRPVKRPHFGGHIESLCGTLNSEIHTLPGTTFSDVNERGEYDSEGNAVMTQSALEKWLIMYITGVYHQRKHEGIGTSPMKRYEEGIFGSDTMPGTGLPAVITDESKFEIDMMPYTMRTVQDDGIVADHIHYYADVLSPWVNSLDLENLKKKRDFIIRRDPRDISVIYFYDPELKTYYDIPYRNKSRPRISLGELKAVMGKLSEDGRKNINEDLIFETYEKMQIIVQEEAKKTRKSKKARKAMQKKNNNLAAVNVFRANRPESTDMQEADKGSDVAVDLVPFEDVDELG